MCLPESHCSCSGHYMPGVQHCAPCCDEPHVDDYVYDVGFLSFPQEIQDDLIAEEKDG